MKKQLIRFTKINFILIILLTLKASLLLIIIVTSMKRKDYLQELKNIFSTCLNIAIKKNHDYAKDADPFSNFKLSELLAEIRTEDGIYTRLLDKVSRVGQLLHKNNFVKGEGIEDSLIDIINYSAILYIYLKNKKTVH